MVRLALLTLIATSGCRKIEPVPKSLDQLVHEVWDELDDGSDQVLVDAVDGLHDAIDGNAFEDILEGEVSDLSEGQVERFGRKVEPGDATGLLLVDRVDCTIPEFEAVVSYEKQDELYTGVYDRYDRTTTSSISEYLTGISDRLTWDLEYETSALGAGYTVNSRTLVRRAFETADGPAVIIRAHLTRPAQFDNEDTNQFLEQDYHLEIYWPHDGGLLHVYALWKDTRLLGFEDESETAQRITLNKLAQWDDGTSQLCTEGLP